MSNEKQNTSGGIGFTGLLTIVFITLKLIGKINWNWWWVLSPIWIVGGIVLLIIGIAFIVASFKGKLDD